MLGLIPEAHYCRFVASDRFYADEPLTTLRHPQVMLAWLMNDEPVPPRHGAPLRLIYPLPIRESERQSDHRDDVFHSGSSDAAIAGLIPLTCLIMGKGRWSAGSPNYRRVVCL